MQNRHSAFLSAQPAAAHSHRFDALWSALVLGRAVFIYVFTTVLALLLIELRVHPVRASGIYMAWTRWYRPRGRRFDDVARLDFWAILAIRWASSRRRTLRNAATFPFHWLGRSLADLEAYGGYVERISGRSKLAQWMESLAIVLCRPQVGLDSLPPYFSLAGYTRDGRAKLYLWVTAIQRLTGLLWAKTIESTGRHELALEDKAVFSGFLEREGLRGPRVVALLNAGQIWSIHGIQQSRLTLPKVNLFVKPVTGAGGLGTSLWTYDNGLYRESNGRRVLTASQLLPELLTATRAGRAVLLQEEVRAGAEWVDLLGPARAGLRVVSCGEGTTARVVSCALKIGRGSSITDNVGSGGLAFPIDVDTGEIREPVGQPAVEAARTSPANGTLIVGRAIPRWREIVDTVTRAHAAVEGLCIAGWDLTVTDDGVTFYECNPEFDNYHIEAADGRPLGELDDVVATLLASLERYCAPLEARTAASKQARFPNGKDTSYTPSLSVAPSASR